MMLWLQEIGQAFPFDFEVSGSKVLVWCPLLKPSRLIPLFGSAAGSSTTSRGWCSATTR